MIKRRIRQTLIVVVALYTTMVVATVALVTGIVCAMVGAVSWVLVAPVVWAGKGLDYLLQETGK